MKKTYLLTVTGLFLSSAYLSYNFYQWISHPNHFVYSKEPYGYWSTWPSLNYEAKSYQARINPICARPVYSKIEKKDQKSLTTEDEKRDFRRFLSNKDAQVEFNPEEVLLPTKFKWLPNYYVTYDDPSAQHGMLPSFQIKCVYDKECQHSEAVNYLLIKIGVRYFLNPAQTEALSKCIESERVYRKVGYNYIFGYSKTHYRYGLLYWLKSLPVLNSWLPEPSST